MKYPARSVQLAGERKQFADLSSAQTISPKSQAMHKALNPLHGIFLEFQGIEVDL
jgi:hypothetical protein